MHRACAALLLLLFSVPALAGKGDTFPRPAELEPAVAFWTRVYSQVSTDGGLIHDRDNLEIVYEQVDLDGLPPHERRAHVRERREHYENLLRRLADRPREEMNAEERDVLALFPRDASRDRLRRAAGNVRFQLGQSDRFRRGLVRSGAWEPHIRHTLREMGLPQELLALAHVESSFNPDAYSRVGAAGIWQFTRSTGQRFMRVDHLIDERMDPFESTIAAARLLRHNHSVTGDWALALTAYNHGLAGVRRAVAEAGSSDIADLIRDYNGRRWGFASRNFYPAFLAAVDVDREYQAHFGVIERHETLRTETIELPFYTPVAAIMEAFDLDRDTFLELNRALRPPVRDGLKHVPRGYTLRVPARPDGPPVQEMLARIDTEAQYFAQVADSHHRVRRGESLSLIAARYNTSVRELVALNNLRSPNHIRVGQNLRLPPGRNAGAIGQVAEGGHYTIRRGDTLSGIARRFGMTTSALAAANGLENYHRIQPGQQLRVDGRAADGARPLLAATTADEGAATEPDADETASQTVAASETGTNQAIAAVLSGPAPVDVVAAADLPAAADGDMATTGTVAIVTTDEAIGGEPVRTARAALEFGVPAAARAARTQTMPAAMVDPAGDPLADDTADDRVVVEEAPPPTPAHADPGDYAVADDGTIEVQTMETLGHYADWLGLRARDLRRINGMTYGTPVVLGDRIALEFSNVQREVFEQRRVAYHQAMQERFFRYYRIAGTETHDVRNGDSLWTLASRRENVPIWLLRQYNPDLDFSRLRVGTQVEIPRVERQPGTAETQLAETEE